MKSLQAYLNEKVIEAGCDEAGRGCLSGPVVASAVILNPNKKIAGLDDSKKLSEKDRILLREEIFAQALDYGVGIVTNFEIDEINILNASFLAMHRAIDALKKCKPEHLLIDGNRFNPYKTIPHSCIITSGNISTQSQRTNSNVKGTSTIFPQCRISHSSITTTSSSTY